MQLNTSGPHHLDINMFMMFTELLVRVGLLGLRRRDHTFTPEVKSTATSQSKFECLLHTIRDARLPGFEAGEQIPDGRTAVGNDPLKHIR
jgi:hypothetical protein